MPTLESMTADWRKAVGDDSGLGEHSIKYDLKGDGFIHIDRTGVTNEDRPATVTFTGKIDVIDGILSGRLSGTKMLMRGKLKISPMSAAPKVQSALEGLIEKLPKDDAATGDEDAEPLVDHPLPPKAADMLHFDKSMYDQLTADSFQPHPDVPGLSLRTMPDAQKHAKGKTGVQVLQAGDTRAWKGPWARTTNALRLNLVTRGSATYDIDGLGQIEFKDGDAWLQPPGNDHSLINFSADFEVFETEFPDTACFVGTMATADMVMRLTDDSYGAIPNFDGAIQRHLPALEKYSDGGAKALMLRANPPHVWDGSPWHIHHMDVQIAYMTKGTADFEFEGMGVLTFTAGLFFFQPYCRHRERRVQFDWEGLNIELPATSATTIFLYDEDAGEYVATKVDDIAEQGGEIMNLIDA
jgi:quercetin dioxygenase-like cupin family protein/putative sterol carrier protein